MQQNDHFGFVQFKITIHELRFHELNTAQHGEPDKPYPKIHAKNQVKPLELQLYSMRYVQEHAAQLSLVLGQHGVTGMDWVASVRSKSAQERERLGCYTPQLVLLR